MLADGIRQIGDGLLEVAADRLQGLLVQADINEIYEVEQTPFARGKFAAVRRAVHKKTGVQFAAKFLRRRRRAQCTLREIGHEIAVLMLCSDSKHIVKLNAVHESRSETALILELATGGELQAILDEDGSLTEHQAQTCMREILKALQYLHAKQIAHLDLKPQNILLCGDKVEDGLKLCDFGISRLVEEVGEVREILGTPDYVAPEVLQYEPLSLATDIWSIGVLAYVLLTGCSPFGGDTKQETFLNISQCALNFPEDLFEDVSAAAQDFIKSALRIKPKERMTATECLSHHWLRHDPHPLPIIRLEHLSPKIHPKDVADDDHDDDVNDVDDDDEVNHVAGDSNGCAYLSTSPASSSLSVSPVSCDRSSSSSSNSGDEHTTSSISNHSSLLNSGNNNTVTSVEPSIDIILTPTAAPLLHTSKPLLQQHIIKDTYNNKENIACNIKYFAAASNGGAKAATTSQQPPALPSSSPPVALPSQHHHGHHPHYQTSPPSYLPVVTPQHHNNHNNHQHPSSHFPDAPTTPKVCRKSSPDSSPSVKALVKKFQLDELERSPTASRRRNDLLMCNMITTTQPTAATTVHTATAEIGTNGCRINLQAMSNGKGVDSAAKPTSTSTTTSVSTSSASNAVASPHTSASSSSTAAATVAGRKPLGGCDHGIIC